MEAYFLSLKFLGALISDPIHYLDAHRLRPLELERLAIGRIEVRPKVSRQVRHNASAL